MTTANLSVGINTAKAKEALAELKAYMMRDMVVNVGLDPTSIDRSINAYFKQRTFKVKVNTKDLAAEVGNDLEVAINRKFQNTTRTLGWNQAAFAGGLNTALRAAFENKSRQLLFDRQRLVADVTLAIEAGVAAAKFKPSAAGVAAVATQASAVAAPLPTAALQATIAQILNPAMEELGKAAALLGGTVRKIGDRETSTKARARVGRSAKDETGATTSYMLPLDDPEAALAKIKQLNAEKEAAAEAERLVREQQQDTNRTFAFRRRFSAATQREVEKAAAAQEKAAKEEVARLAAEARESQADSNRTFAFRRRYAASTQKELEKAAAAQERAAREEAARLAAEAREAQADSNRTFAFRRRYAAAQQREAREAEKATEELARQQAIARRAQLARAYQDAQDDVRGKYTGRGVQIAAAQRLAGQFGTSAAAGFLGKDAGLLDRGGELENYVRKAKAAGEAAKVATPHTHLFKDAMNEAHSAARGLAGSLGALWLTWGSVIPLAAGAALGSMLVGVLKNGKDVEYQLAFVSALSDGAAVSTRKLNDALAGTLVGPKEAAEAMRGLAQNGLSVQESFIALPSILRLATAGEMSLSEAALGATGVMAAFNLQVTDLGRVSDVFVKAAAISNTSVGGMVEAMKQASTVSDQYHVSLEETAATLSVLAKRNIEGTSAGTAFRMMMTELATPSTKATAMLKQLGIQLYDGSGQLKSYSELLNILKERTTTLNEKGRLTFLNEIFNERGAKAVNALLSDFDVYNKNLDEIKNKSKDFTESVNEALTATTQGKLKSLMSEFQQATVTAFEDSKNSVNNFIDALRQLVASNEFKEFLANVTTGVTNLTNFLRDNAKAILLVVEAWAAFKVAQIIVGLSGLQVGISAITAAATAGRFALLGMMSAATLGVGLVATLAIEWLTYRSSADQATEAQRALNNQLELNNKSMEANLRNLEEENRLTGQKLALMQEGYSANKAAAVLQEREAKKKGVDLQREVEAAKAKIEADKEARAAQLAWRRGGSQGLPPSREAILTPEGLEQAKRTLEENQRALSLFQANEAAKRTKIDQDEAAHRLKIAHDFNARLSEITRANQRQGKKVNLDGLFITQGDTQGDPAVFEEMVRRRNEELNKRLPTVTKPDADARAEALARFRATATQLREEQVVQSERLKLNKMLEEARYPVAVFGAGAAAALTEARNIRAANEELQLQVDLVKKMEAAAKDKNIKDADRITLQAEIDKEKQKLSLKREQLAVQTEVARLNAEEFLRKDNESFSKETRSLAIADDKRLDKLRESYSTKVKTPQDAAAESAVLSVKEAYAQRIADQEAKQATAQTALVQLKEQMRGMSVAEVDKAEEEQALLEAHLAVETARLTVLRAQASAAAATAAAVGRSEAENAQTAGYGWEKFWNNYRENALSNAAIVESVMKKTTDSMSDAFANFVLTGKLNFRGLVATIIAEAARAMAAKGVTSLLGLAASYLGGVFGGSPTLPDAAPTNIGGNAFANGGIMTSMGPLPLRAYSAGGVARSPQLALYGEGRKPEAYVPLPDGRSIPVTVQGGGGGGNVTVSISVHVDSNGNSQVESDASGKKAQQLASLVESAITERIVREKRPGGLLY